MNPKDRLLSQGPGVSDDGRHLRYHIIRNGSRREMDTLSQHPGSIRMLENTNRYTPIETISETADHQRNELSLAQRVPTIVQSGSTGQSLEEIGQQDATDTDTGFYIGCHVDGYPDLDWKPTMTRQKSLIYLTFASLLLGTIFLGVRYLAQQYTSSVSTTSYGLNIVMLQVLSLSALFYYEAWFLVDRGVCQLFPFYNLVNGPSDKNRDPLLCQYFPDPPWYIIFSALLRRHWIVASTNLALYICAIILAFQSTILGYRRIIVSEPLELQLPPGIEISFIPFLNSSLGKSSAIQDLEHLTSIGSQVYLPSNAHTFNAYEAAILPFIRIDGSRPSGAEVWVAKTSVITGFLECRPQSIILANQQVEARAEISGENCTANLGISPQHQFYWGTFNGTSPEVCRNEYLFGYGELQSEEGRQKYLAIRCSTSVYFQNIDVRAQGNMGSRLQSKKMDLFTDSLDKSVFQKVPENRINISSEAVLAEVLNTALFERELSKSQYWYNYTTPYESPWEWHSLQIDPKKAKVDYSPTSISELEKLANRAYRRILSQVIATAIDTVIPFSLISENLINGTHYSAEGMYTPSPNICLVISIAYYVLGCFSIGLIFASRKKIYRYSGLKGDPSTLLYNMIMTCKSARLQEVFSGLEFTEGGDAINGRLQGLIFRLGYWKVGNTIEYKLDYVDKMEESIPSGSDHYTQTVFSWAAAHWRSAVKSLGCISSTESTTSGSPLGVDVHKGLLPWHLNIYIYTFMMLSVVSSWILLIVFSHVNGSLPDWSIASNLDYNPVFFGLRYEDILWKPAASLVIFIFFTVWIQGIIRSFAIQRPLAELRANASSSKPLFRNSYVTPLNAWGLSFCKLEYGNGLRFLGFLSSTLYVTLSMEHSVVQPSYEDEVITPSTFLKEATYLPEFSATLPPMQDTLLLTYQKDPFIYFNPPFSSTAGYYANFAPMNVSVMPSQTKIGTLNGKTDFFFANFTECVVMNETEFRFPMANTTMDGIPVYTFGTGQMLIPNCTLSADTVSLCPYANVTSFIDDYRYGEVCGGWNLIQSTTGNPSDCQLNDNWLIHEVSSRYPPIVGANGTSIYTVQRELPISSVAVACSPKFWVTRDAPVEISIGSNRVIFSDFTNKHHPKFNGSLLMPQKGFHDQFRQSYNEILSTAIQQMANLSDQNLYEADVPYRLTRSFQGEPITLPERASDAFSRIFSMYLANERIFWKQKNTEEIASSTVFEGFQNLTSATVEVDYGILINIIVFMSVFFIFSFPFPRRIDPYRLPRPLTCIASYITYFHSSPLLEEVRNEVNSDMDHYTAAARLWRFWDSGSTFVMGKKDDMSKSQLRTYTIRRVDLPTQDKVTKLKKGIWKVF